MGQHDFVVIFPVSLNDCTRRLMHVCTCNRVYCIHIPGPDPLIFSFLYFILFDWVGILWPQLSKVLKPVRWAGSVRGLQARSKDQEILEEGGGAGPSS